MGWWVCSATGVEPAAWLASRQGTWWTVGWLVPSGYDGILRVELEFGDRHAGADLAAVCAAHTTTPGRTWAAVWEGHGFTRWQSCIAVFGTGPEARRYQQERQAGLRREDEVR